VPQGVQLFVREFHRFSTSLHNWRFESDSPPARRST